jgi:hypothetical protein
MSKKKLKKCLPNLEWEVEEIVNKDGSIGNKYYYKGIPAIKIPLQGGIATSIAGYTLIYHDLRMILLWLQIVIDEHKKIGLDKTKQSIVRITPDNLRSKLDVIKGFMVASISFYGKLFTQAEGRKVKLEKNIFQQNQELLKSHKDIMMYRHNFSAHSGKERVEYVEVSLILDSKKERQTLPFLVRTIDQPHAFKNKFLEDFVKVCEYLLENVNTKINLLNNKYYKNLTPEKIEMMYRISKL